MTSSVLIAARVSVKTKGRLVALARAQGLTESVMLKRIVESAFQFTGSPAPESADVTPPRDRGARLYVRLENDDRVVLRERAAARGMPAATYAALLIRAHLRSLTPLPTQELKELRAAVGAVGAIERNLNQIARVANETGQINGLSINTLRLVTRACVVLRQHFLNALLANLRSWENGRPVGSESVPRRLLSLPKLSRLVKI